MTNSPRKEFQIGRVLPELQVIHDSTPKSAAMNMAVDEALLLTAVRPMLRFYGWRQPSLSFGYFGRFSDVEGEESERELVRRWTGGGIVFHGTDLTYSIIVPRGHDPEMPSPQTVYGHVHAAMRDALSTHLEVVLASADAPKFSETCFANAVTSDVLIGERKIAGAAQRRTRAGLLHQGSILHESLPALFPDKFAAALCANFDTTSLAPKVERSAKALVERKYETVEWLQRR